MTETTWHFEVNDGTGTATVWTCKRFRSGRVEVGEFVGRVVGVHTVAEAEAAWKAQSCTGTGQPWQSGTGHPICPVCHRGVVSITGVRRSMKQMRGKAVPEHERRTR